MSGEKLAGVVAEPKGSPYQWALVVCGQTCKKAHGKEVLDPIAESINLSMYGVQAMARVADLFKEAIYGNEENYAIDWEKIRIAIKAYETTKGAE